MTLTGFDIYSGTPESDVVKALAADFVIVKATEGTTYVNPKHDEHVQRARDAGKLVGHYHFAHVTNDPVAEAAFFVATARARPGDVIDLDFEPYGQPAPDSVYPGWIVAFADEVLRLTRIRGWIYLNDDMGRRIAATASPDAPAATRDFIPASQLPPSTRSQATPPTLTYALRDMAPAASASMTTIRQMPLWKAAYTATPGNLLGWPEITCWQKSSTPMDADDFFGDAARWRSLGIPQEGNMADLTPQNLADIGKAAADAVYARRFKKVTNPTDTTSLGDMLVWWEPVLLGEVDQIQAAMAATPDPTAEDIAEAVVALLPEGADPNEFLDALRARLES